MTLEEKRKYNREWRAKRMRKDADFRKLALYRNREYLRKRRETDPEYKQKLIELNKEWARKQRLDPECRKKFALAQRKYEKNLSIDKKIQRTERQRVRRLKRRQVDPQYGLLCSLRSRVYNVMKGNTKSFAILELLGCSLKELKKHIENQFQKGMSWENYGFYGWHIDHIIPCSKFNLIDPEQQKTCFNYSNLQPLWAIDNLRKSNN